MDYYVDALFQSMLEPTKVFYAFSESSLSPETVPISHRRVSSTTSVSIAVPLVDF